MRRHALIVPTLLLLAGCANSGYWRYQQDVITLPGANPNQPTGKSETYTLVRHKQSFEAPAPLLTEAGDVWPGTPKAVPTLRDLQLQQNNALGSNTLTGGEGLKPLPPLPVLPGFETPPQQAPSPPPEPVFPNQIVPPPPGAPGRGLHFGQPQNYQGAPGAGGRESIVVPNGNGTSTVIGPNGEVSTIPTPK